MGLRDDAEKIIAEQDARAVEAEHQNLTPAREKVPEAMAAWSEGMGLEKVPDYTVTEANYRGRDDDDYPSAFVEISFEVDGIGFWASLKLYLGRVFFKVTMAGTNGGEISTVEGVAAGLRQLNNLGS